MIANRTTKGSVEFVNRAGQSGRKDRLFLVVLPRGGTNHLRGHHVIHSAMSNIDHFTVSVIKYQRI